MSAHTKGPWTIAPKKTWSASIGLVVTGKPTPVAWASRLAKGGDDEAQANAHLIAAAPELLAVARRWLRVMGDAGSDRCACCPDEYVCCRCEVVAAIAKAEGKS